MRPAIPLGQYVIGPGHPCFVIAEAGVNHNGDIDLACRLIDAAAEAGASAVKFQSFRTDQLVTASAPKAQYQRESTDAEESQSAMLRKLELSEGAHRRLLGHANERGIIFLSTPFDEFSADLLTTLGVPAFKLPSGELTNLLFVAYVAKKARPLIMSTGMAYLGEVEAAVRAIYATGNTDLCLLHCLSAYPAPEREVNLRAMHTLELAFGVPVGYSDHTLGSAISLAAVALGACVIEKHFTLDRTLPGPDHQASVEPDELAGLIQGIRHVQSALGSGRKEPAPSELDTASVARRSLVAAQDIAAGEVIAVETICFRRPGSGLPPAMLPYVAGRTARAHIAAGTLITLDLVA